MNRTTPTEIVNEDSGAGVEYLEYQELQPTDEELPAVLQALHSEDWKDNFLAIQQLRAFNKFRWEDLCLVWAQSAHKLLELIDSIRSSVSKHALMLLSEIFMAPRYGMESFVELALPILLVKAINEKAFIRNEAKKTLEYISSNCPYESTAYILCSHCFHKSGTISDIAYTHLQKTFGSLVPAVVFGICVQLLDSKRAPTLKGTKEQLIHLQKSWADFKIAVNELDHLQQRKIQRWLEQRPERKAGNLRDMIKRRKKEPVQPVFELVE